MWLKIGIDLLVEQLAVGTGRRGARDRARRGSSSGPPPSSLPGAASRGRACRGGAPRSSLALSLTSSRSSSVSSGSGWVSRSKMASASSSRSSTTARCSSSVRILESSMSRRRYSSMLKLPALYCGDQLFDALDEIVAGRVRSRRRIARSVEQRGQAVGLRSLPPGERGGQRLEVDLRQVDERVGFAAFGRGPDDVLLRSDRAVEQCVDGVADLGDVGCPVGRVSSAMLLGHGPDRRDGRLVGGGSRIGQHGLEQLPGLAGRRRGTRSRTSSSASSASTAASRSAMYSKPDASRSGDEVDAVRPRRAR